MTHFSMNSTYNADNFAYKSLKKAVKITALKQQDYEKETKLKYIFQKIIIKTNHTESLIEMQDKQAYKNKGIEKKCHDKAAIKFAKFIKIACFHLQTQEK